MKKERMPDEDFDYCLRVIKLASEFQGPAKAWELINNILPWADTDDRRYALETLEKEVHPK